MYVLITQLMRHSGQKKKISSNAVPKSSRAERSISSIEKRERRRRDLDFSPSGAI